MKLRSLDIVVVIILPLIATAVTILFNANLLVSVLLFFGVPSVYLTIRNPAIFKKSFAFAFLLSIPLSLFIDALAAINGSWVVLVTLFPFRFFGAATVEVYLYGLLWVLFAILFYEHFLDKGKKKDRISPHVKYLLYLSVALVLYTVFAYFFNKDLLFIPYFYLLCGSVLVIIPLLIFLYHYPKFLRRYITLGIYFFYTLFAFEIAALHTGQWIFPAKDFIGMITIARYQFPVEELVIWIVAATLALISYYEFFADDRKL